MIAWLLRRMGMHDDLRCPPPAAMADAPGERHFDQARLAAERTLHRADRETERARIRLVSWEDLYDPRRRS